MRTPAPRQLPSSSVSSLVAFAVTTADQPINVFRFSCRSASKYLSLETLPASLLELKQNDFGGPKLVPSVTMSPVTSTPGNIIPIIRHTIDSGVCVLRTLTDMFEWNERPGSTSKFQQDVQAGSSILGPTPGHELLDKFQRCKD